MSKDHAIGKENDSSTATMFLLRPVTPEDEPFLFYLYAGTRSAEMALLDWTEEQKKIFLRMQFEAQQRFYRDQFRAARFDAVEMDGKPAGRLYVDRTPEELRIIDISLLPECQGRGIGKALIHQVLAEASDANLPVRIHVLKGNPARKLYGQLGFVTTGETEIYDLMEWRLAPISACT
jgi:ribosomal protein S18 acetylase RimI-like enzyme